MRVLVTGAGGFTGDFVLAALRSFGDEPHALEGDLQDQQGIRQQVAALRPEATIHLAARAFVASDEIDDFYATNQLGSFHLLDALARHVPGTPVLLASSAQVYAAEQSGLLDESTPTEPSNHYGLSKLAMEMGSRFWGDRLRLIIARPFNYTGVGQEKRYLVPKIVDHFAHRAPVIELGNVEVERDFGDVRSVGEAYVALIHDASAIGIYNVSTGMLSTVRNIVNQLVDITGHRVEIRINPDFVRANDISSLGGNNQRLRDTLPHWKPRPLADTLAWMLSHASSSQRPDARGIVR